MSTILRVAIGFLLFAVSSFVIYFEQMFEGQRKYGYSYCGWVCLFVSWSLLIIDSL